MLELYCYQNVETLWRVLLFEQLGLGENVPAQCKGIGLDGL